MKHKVLLQAQSNYQKSVVSVLRSYYRKLPPRKILYRNVKRFENLNPPSVAPIKSSVTQNSKFNLPHATTQDINKIINR